MRRKRASNRTSSDQNSAYPDSVLDFDSIRQQITVEPGLSMEGLVDALLSQGFMPKVTPEFKGITVGGALFGGALESSSYRFGQFNDTALSYTLKDGRILSPNNEPELFEGLSSSYGTLAHIQKATIGVQPAPRALRLDLHNLNNKEAMLHRIEELASDQSTLFIEGIGYAPNQWVVISGNEGKSPRSIKLTSRSPWFYEQIDHLIKKGVGCAEIDLRAYLFRHDQGAFWMARYLRSFQTFLLYLFQREPNEAQFHRLISKLKKVENQRSPALLRGILGKQLSSQSLYHTLHQTPREWVRQYLMIQDCYIPIKGVPAFLGWVEKEIGLFPIWLCPIRSASSKQVLAAHASERDELFINVGIYGIPNRKKRAGELVAQLEKVVASLGGKKMLYADHFYDIEPFWEIYDKEKYFNLKRRLDPSARLPCITEKILS